MTTLDQVPLEDRVRGVHDILRAEPGLSVEQRAQLVAAAVWPLPVQCPSGQAPSKSERRAEAVTAHTNGETIPSISARLGVPFATVKWWCSSAAKASTLIANSAARGEGVPWSSDG